MWGFQWEPVVTSAVTGVLALAGVVVTVRSQSTKTRAAGATQHLEQNEKLNQLLTKQEIINVKVDQNKLVAENGIAELNFKVQGLAAAHETLFSMLVDVDRKVSGETPVQLKRTTDTELEKHRR